jgi:hypothetical protein
MYEYYRYTDPNMFTEQERTEVSEWEIYLHPEVGVSFPINKDELPSEQAQSELEKLSLTPMSLEMGSICTYVEGTYRDAYEHAEQMCRELAATEVMGQSEWCFERGSIRRL